MNCTAKMEKAQPQTIEAADGFPMENLNFGGRAQEIMAIIQKNKPMAMTEFDKNYKFHNFTATFIKDGKEVKVQHRCKKYTYKQVYEKSKQVNLVYYPFPDFKQEDGFARKVKLFFLKENTKDAYILWEMWENDNDLGIDSHDSWHTTVGILLGYEKKDIRSWFIMKLRHEFEMDFDNLDQRTEFIQRPEFKKRRDEIAEKFETTWVESNQKLQEIRKNIVVPEEWESNLKTLEAL